MSVNESLGVLVIDSLTVRLGGPVGVEVPALGNGARARPQLVHHVLLVVRVDLVVVVDLCGHVSRTEHGDGSRPPLLVTPPVVPHAPGMPVVPVSRQSLRLRCCVQAEPTVQCSAYMDMSAGM